MKLLYATKNKHKIHNMRLRIKNLPIELLTPEDLNININIEEDGQTPCENALKKAKTYYEISKIPTIAGDTGLYIKNLPPDLQPSLNVRRVNSKRLNDEEMLEYYLNIIEEYNESKGHYTTGLALITKDGEYTREIKEDERIFTKVKSSIKVPNSDPLDVISIDPKTKKYYSELEDSEKLQLGLKFDKECIKFLKKYLLKGD